MFSHLKRKPKAKPDRGMLKVNPSLYTFQSPFYTFTPLATEYTLPIDLIEAEIMARSHLANLRYTIQCHLVRSGQLEASDVD